MNITFMVGNGFDINLGLNTRYTDFYPFYLQKQHNDILSRAIKDRYERWSDLEIALGKILKDVSFDQIEEFLISKENLEYALAEYLRNEQKRININGRKLSDEFHRKISAFFDEFIAGELDYYCDLEWEARPQIQYHFVSFNYTSILDTIIRQAKTPQSFFSRISSDNRYTNSIGDVLHIHGTLDSGMILGVDNVDQIDNVNLRTAKALTEYIVKARVNEALGRKCVENAKSIIDNSDYIGIYGLSLGDTDSMWWHYILKWLQKGPDHRLFLFAYENSVDNPSAQYQLRRTKLWKDEFLTKADANAAAAAQVKNRILVVTSSRIFDFSSITVRDNHGVYSER